MNFQTMLFSSLKSIFGIIVELRWQFLELTIVVKQLELFVSVEVDPLSDGVSSGILVLSETFLKKARVIGDAPVVAAVTPRHIETIGPRGGSSVCSTH